MYFICRCASSKAYKYPCFPIRFNRKEPDCTAFARSAAVCKNDYDKKSVREQINKLSAYLDLSQVYSNDFHMNRRLRRLDGKYLTYTSDLKSFY